MTETIRLHLRLLGSFEGLIRSPDGETVTPGVSERAMAKVALGVIVYDGQPGFAVEADRLTRILWEEVVDGPGELSYVGNVEKFRTGEEIARGRLTRLLNDVRNMIGGGSRLDFVDRPGASIALVNTSADLVDFDQHWKEGRHEAAREIAERGALLAGVQLQRRHESARRWLQATREDWSRRVDDLFRGKETELAAAGEAKEAARWATARRTVALAHGIDELVESAQQNMRRYESNGSPVSSPGQAGMERATRPFGSLQVELDTIAGTDSEARVALLCGDTTVRGSLHAAALLGPDELELSLPRGASRPFSHACALREALAGVTHCLYVLANGESSNSGWAAFSKALAEQAELPFRIVVFAGQETVR